MSYSVCLNCKSMVRNYEKYCDKCAQEYQQDEIFWKSSGYDFYEEPKRTEELAKDIKARAFLEIVKGQRA